MLSTILFITDKPIGYTVIVSDHSCYFKPAEHPGTEVQAPSFEVLYQDDEWVFDPFFDWALRDQILETFPFTVIKDAMRAEVTAAP